jgi:hypothetical protein
MGTTSVHRNHHPVDGNGDYRGPELLDADVYNFIGSLDLSAFGEGECIMDVDVEIVNAAFDLRVAEYDVHGAQITSRFVDERCFGPGAPFAGTISREYPSGSGPNVANLLLEVLIALRRHPHAAKGLSQASKRSELVPP